MGLVADLLVAAVSVAIMIQHGWATREHFVSRTLTPGSATIAAGVVITSLIYLVLLFGVEQSPWAQIAGLVIELAGLWLFWGAIKASRNARLQFVFSDVAPHGVLTSGPYARIRHPFYASYILVWIGWAVATWSAWAMIPLVLMTAIYARAALFEEQLFAGTPLAAEYAAYRKRAGMFWPKP